MGIRYSSVLIVGVILLTCSCRSSNPGRHSPRVDSPPGAQALVDGAAEFAEHVLGDRLSVHYTEHVRGNIGVDALFESEHLIGYTTFSNDRYQKVSSPVDLEDCILFVGRFEDAGGAEQAFDLLKASSLMSAADVEGLVGVTPVQVRFLEKIRNDGGGGMFAHQGSVVFFLTEYADVPPITASWTDYENLFLTSIAGGGGSLETIRLR